MKIFLFIFYVIFPFLLFGQQARFYSYTVNQGLCNNYINRITQDKTGYLWVATRMGISRFNGVEFRNYLNNPLDSTSLPYNSVLSLFVDSNNTLWLGSYGSKVASFDSKSETFTSYSFENKSETKDLDIFDIFSNSKQEICLVTRLGIYTLHNNTFVKDTVSQYNHKDNSEILINNELWQCTNKGLKFISPITGGRYYTTENTPELVSNSFQSVFKDKDGIIWFGTHGGGLVNVTKSHNDLQYYSTKNILLKNNIVSDFYSDAKGQNWIATDGGGITVFDNNNSFLQQINSPAYPESNSVLDFCVNESTLWAAGWQSGVFSINTQNNKITSYKNAFAKLGITNNIKAVALKGDTVFCGSYGNGVILINKKTGKIVTHNKTNNRNELIIQLYINDIYVDSDNTVWIASVRGLYKYENGVMIYIPIDATDPHNVDKSVIISIREGNNKNLLIATSAGAYILQKSNSKIQKVQFDLGVSKEVKFIIQDSQNRYWIGASDKIYLVGENNATIASMKLTQTERTLDVLNNGAIYCDSKGYYFIGTQDGFYSFHPDSINLELPAPKILLENISINYNRIIAGENSILSKHCNETSKIQLNYNDFPLTISFASLNFNPRTSIQFSYKLIGVDSLWIPVKGNNELTFHNLAPGNYTLQLRNTNIYGKASNQLRELQIIVKPPFWFQFWFIVLVIVLLVLTILILFHYRVQRIRNQKIILESEVAKQTEVLLKQNAEITDHKKKLEDQADVLQGKLLELHDQKEDLEALNTELNEQSTELVTKNKQLNDVVDTKTKLLSIIAHDIKNPFHVILLAAKQLFDSNKNLAYKDKENTERIYTASKNVFALVSNLLDWAMSQSGLISYSPVNIHCIDFLQSVVEENKPYALQKNIRVSLSCDDKFWCFADEQMIRIVIRNLFHNSMKFTPEGGMISILCSYDNAHLKIEVIDTGVGMDSSVIEKLFEVDSVISEKGTRDEEGRGLGLLVVKDFVTRNNGSIEVTSKKKNGSNFIIRLPKGNAEFSPVQQMSNETPLVKTIQFQKQNNISVLLVDDNDKLRNQLSQSLGDIFTVTACSNATEALNVLKTNKVHLVVSDIVMGEIDGISFCKIIKNELKLSIPIILITGVDSTDAQVSAYNSGADDFIKKPFELDVLIARMQNLLVAQNNSRSSSFDIGSSKLKPQDEIFAEKLRVEVEKGISDAEFSVEVLATRMGTSRANLYKKTKKAIGISPSDYIHHARLEVASVLLKENKYRIAEVAYMVGYSDPLYFSSCFSKHYGVSPTDFKSKF